ncbi:hypothetical protein [Pseudomonas sp. NFR16]|uniref:hypothetical protein n=1 Tax=Pseudomonas sp. NFR16 TaxID=1566248 RepID=UPI00116086CB|nr:hypothetical protein [Pseudomonas sp. NFR16]
MRTSFSGFFARAAGSTVLALFSVGSAAFVSVCSTAILAQAKALVLPPVKGAVPACPLELAWALGLSSLAVMFVWLRERGLADLTAAKEAELASQGREMEGRLTNLPPRQFIEEYVAAIRSVGELRRLSKEEVREKKVDLEMLNSRVRAILASILSLTRLWDGVATANKTVVYQANVMKVLMREEISTNPAPELNFDKDGAANDSPTEVSNSLEKWLLQFEFFLHNQSYGVAVERCSGIVFIQDAAFSATSTLDDDVPDPSIEQICLPFTYDQEYREGFHHPNLPGAPSVVAFQASEYLSNVQDFMEGWLAKQARRNPELNERYEEGLRKYYDKLKAVKSLISIPIFSEDRLIGVLNINKNNENMLLNADRADLFIQLLTPICYHLGKMLMLIEDMSFAMVQEE